MNNSELTGLIGFLLSLVLEYAPWIKGYFEAQSPQMKVAVVVIFTAVFALIVTLSGGDVNEDILTGFLEFLQNAGIGLGSVAATHYLFKKR